MKKNGYLVFLCLGFCLLAGGIWGTVSLLEAFGEYLRATGVVERVHKERVYRPRRTRTVLRVDIYYDTERYGLLSLTPEFYLPFVMDEGDKLTVLYHPDRPRDVRLPLPEGLLYGLLLLFGAICVWIGWKLRPSAGKHAT